MSEVYTSLEDPSAPHPGNTESPVFVEPAQRISKAQTLPIGDDPETVPEALTDWSVALPQHPPDPLRLQYEGESLRARYEEQNLNPTEQVSAREESIRHVEATLREGTHPILSSDQQPNFIQQIFARLRRKSVAPGSRPVSSTVSNNTEIPTEEAV